MKSPINLPQLSALLKPAFTQFPYAIATYVCLGGMLWLILAKFF